MSNYPRGKVPTRPVTQNLDIYEFGRSLIRTGDLDPVYILAHNAGWSKPKLQAWCLAYWCFYHVGTASWIVDGFVQDAMYWKRMELAATSSDYPRSTERRHFRAANAVKSVSFLKKKGLTVLFNAFSDPHTLSLETVMKEIQSWVGFGPWIAFKVADMVERLGLARIDFSRTYDFLYTSPLETAQQWWRKEHPGQGRRSPNKDEARWAFNRLHEQLGTIKAPPRGERRLGFQEYETILCKWGSFCKGRYHVGEDVEACHKALERFPQSPTAQQLFAVGKKFLWNKGG